MGLSLSLVIALALSGQGGGNRLHDDAYWEEGGRFGNAGIGINAFLSVFIYSVCRKKMFFSLHISVVYGPYVEPNKRVVQYPLGNF